MKNLILFDSEDRDHLLPFTYTRPVCEIRVGILTIREKWERALSGKASYITQDYLSDKYDISIAENNYIINGAVLPTPELLGLIAEMGTNEALLHEGELIIARLDKRQFEVLMHEDEIEELASFETNNLDLFRIKNLWDITRFNARAIQLDFDLLTANRTSAPISATNRILGEENIFMEPGARVEFATINATAGPVYIGKDAEIMEGALIRGPFAMGEHAVVKMGAKIYGATTLGPWCKVGGEVSNSVLFGFSNKGHDGFLGDSVIGEWCNIGADTNNSNLKNNYTEVKLWNYPAGRFIKTGQQFCGLFMGDHSKCGINTMFNTGTVVGVSANIFGDGFPRNFIPSFAWGGAAGFTTFKTDKAFETAEAMMRRRHKTLDTLNRVILLKVFEESAHWRAWEKADA